MGGGQGGTFCLVCGVVIATERVGGDDAIEFHKDRLKARGLGEESSPLGAMATDNTDFSSLEGPGETPALHGQGLQLRIEPLCYI